MTKLAEIIEAQNWENWRGEKSGEFWDICQVLHCKLEHIREYLAPTFFDQDDTDEVEEYRDTIKCVQDILALLDEEKLHKICP